MKFSQLDLVLDFYLLMQTLGLGLHFILYKRGEKEKIINIDLEWYERDLFVIWNRLFDCRSNSL
jgi:hypothetical protein